MVVVVVVSSFDGVVLDFYSALKESTVAPFRPHLLLPIYSPMKRHDHFPGRFHARLFAIDSFFLLVPSFHKRWKKPTRIELGRDM
jgi:hypothetical protein